MRRVFGSRFLFTLALLAVTSLTSLAQGANPHLVVNTHRLNVRSGPSVAHNILTSVPGGTVLPVTAIDSGRRWFQVSSPAGTGWVNSHYTVSRGNFIGMPVLGADTDAGLAIPYGGPHLVVNTWRLNLRSGPGIGYAVMGVVAGGARLPVVAVDSRGLWHQVDTTAGRGWVNAHYAAKRGNFGSLPRVQQDGTITQPVDPGATGAHLTGLTPRVVVNTHRLNIRSGPGVGNAVITSVPGGTTLAVLGRSQGGWYMVAGSFGQGWLSSGFVAFRGSFSRVPLLN